MAFALNDGFGRSIQRYSTKFRQLQCVISTKVRGIKRAGLLRFLAARSWHESGEDQLH